MPTPGERITSLEVTVREHERRIESLEDYLNGGGDVEYPRSVRGRLHSVEGTLAAMGVVTKQRVSIIRGGWALLLGFCSIVVAVCAIITALHVLTAH